MFAHPPGAQRPGCVSLHPSFLLPREPRARDSWLSHAGFPVLCPASFCPPSLPDVVSVLAPPYPVQAVLEIIWGSWEIIVSHAVAMDTAGCWGDRLPSDLRHVGPTCPKPMHW